MSANWLPDPCRATPNVCPTELSHEIAKVVAKQFFTFEGGLLSVGVVCWALCKVVVPVLFQNAFFHDPVCSSLFPTSYHVRL